MYTAKESTLLVDTDTTKLTSTTPGKLALPLCTVCFEKGVKPVEVKRSDKVNEQLERKQQKQEQKETQKQEAKRKATEKAEQKAAAPVKAARKAKGKAAAPAAAKGAPAAKKPKSDNPQSVTMRTFFTVKPSSSQAGMGASSSTAADDDDEVECVGSRRQPVRPAEDEEDGCESCGRGSKEGLFPLREIEAYGKPMGAAVDAAFCSPI